MNHFGAFYLVALAVVSLPFSSAIANDETATASWPPEEVSLKAREEFSARRDALDLLVQKMKATSYMVVHRVQSGLFEAVPVGARAGEYENPADSEVWEGLFVAAGVDWVSRNIEDVVSMINVNDKSESNGKLFRFRFDWSPAQTTPACVSEHSQFRCGRCQHPLENHWSIEYSWQPMNSKAWSRQESKDCFSAFTPVSKQEENRARTQ